MNKQHSTVEFIREVEEATIQRLTRSRKSALQKYPYLFVILTTIGTILTWNGIQKFIDRVDWLITNPLLMLTVGLVTLFLTGALYKKLG